MLVGLDTYPPTDFRYNNCEMAGQEFYSDDEVNEILQRALRIQETHQPNKALEVSAAELGISSEHLEAAKVEFEVKKDWDQFMRERQGEIRQHFLSYVFVNIGLLVINLVTSPQHLWFFYPLLGWGFGLLGHWFSTRSNSSQLDQEFIEWREKRSESLRIPLASRIKD